MIAVSLKAIVKIEEAAALIPAEYTQLVMVCEACQLGPSEDGADADRTPFGVVADWCRENAEPELAAAWTWLHKRPAQRLAIQAAGKRSMWYLPDPPRVLGYGGIYGESGCGLSSLVAELADRLAEMRRELE